MFYLSRAKFLSFALWGLAGTISAGLVSCGGGETGGSSADMPFVAVSQFVEHPSLDAVQKGIKEGLEEAGYKDGESLRWELLSAQANPATAAQIAQKYAAARPDVIVAIATPSAQSAVSKAGNIPVIFSAVTDPLAAKLVESVEKPGGSVSGVSDLSPVKQHLALIKEILPEAETLGVIYSAGEDNSVSLVNLVKENASEAGFNEVREATVASSSEVATAARSLVGSVDAIYVPTDNTVVSALESVVQVGKENSLPVFSGDTDSVERGVIASIGFNYYDIGIQTGEMVVKILKGARPGDLPVEFANVLRLYINPSAAESMGVTLPESVIERADETVQ
ncbi:MAG: ABC transporter permease [Leptolyngbya foveolarum]|uniref:ABC transporter permease n=1 Tax=Leptolyngbya foveolarum TaxID=47253 RepID=A0A2W4U7X7_9CYAN|nr:MAG: ABC transporter permease [Leptolyngbya foveolarum]